MGQLWGRAVTLLCPPGGGCGVAEARLRWGLPGWHREHRGVGLPYGALWGGDGGLPHRAPGGSVSSVGFCGAALRGIVEHCRALWGGCMRYSGALWGGAVGHRVVLWGGSVVHNGALWGGAMGWRYGAQWGTVGWRYGADPFLPHRKQCRMSCGTSQSSTAATGPPGTAPHFCPPSTSQPHI